MGQVMGAIEYSIRFQFLQQIEAVLAVPVHFVNEDDHRGVAHSANLHQPAGLRFNSITLSITNTTLSTAVRVR
jgi:hypothetical protein